MKEDNNSNKSLQVLNKSELCGRQFTVYGTAEQPLFKAADVAAIIEHSNPRSMVQMVDDEEKTKALTPVNNPYGVGQEEETWFLTEDGLYEVLMQSRKPIAKDFKKGVKTILKEIRTNGGYLSTTPDDTPELILAKAVKIADLKIREQAEQLREARQHIAIAEEAIEQNERQLKMANGTIEEQKKQINALAPQAEYTEKVLMSDSTYAVSDVAKELKMTGNKLYARLKEMNILFKRGERWFPYDKYVPQEYFATRTIPFTHRDGTPGSSSYTVVTEKGRKWLHSLNLSK